MTPVSASLISINNSLSEDVRLTDSPKNDVIDDGDRAKVLLDTWIVYECANFTW
jgi:hypothetical protein